MRLRKQPYGSQSSRIATRAWRQGQGRLAVRLLRRVFAWVMVLLFAVVPTHAQFDMNQPVSLTTAWSADKARPGDQRVLAVVLNIAGKFHINPEAKQLSAEFAFLIPTSITVAVGGATLDVGPIQWPIPEAVEVDYGGGAKSLPVLVDGMAVYVPFIVPDDASSGEAVVTLTVEYQACDDKLCLPPKTVTLTTPLMIVSPDAAVATVPDSEVFRGFDPAVFAAMRAGDVTNVETVSFDLFGYGFELDAATGLGFVFLLLVAAAGGLLLNFTPCVLPVIPIKIMGLSQSAGNRAKCLLLGAAMAAGVVAFWLALGGMIAILPAFNQTNELFQHEWFTIGVGLVITIMAVGMCGLFAIRLPRFVYSVSPKHDSLPGSFGFGIMTAVLSTPCTAPFMGAAAAWSVTQPRITTLATFAAIGAGMALPYLILAAFPKLVDKMPRTGPASELIKQVMGLLMLAAAAYFIGVGVSIATVTPPDPPSLMYWWFVAVFIVAAGAWLGYRTWRITGSAVKRSVWTAVALLTIAISTYGARQLTSEGPIDWVYYTPDRLDAALADGQVVVMDFTAEWCLNCKALEHTVLYSDRVVELIDGPNVTPMKVDISSSANVQGAAKLAELGRVAIPLLVVFAPSGEQVFESDFYTIDQVVVAIESAKTAN